MTPPLDDRGRAEVLDLCLQIGEVLVANGLPADDTTRALERVTAALLGRRAEVAVLYQTIVVSDPGDADHVPLTRLHVVRSGATQLNRLAAVERLVTDIEAGRSGVVDALAALERSAGERGPYPAWVAFLAQGLTVAAWTVTLGGGPIAAAVGAGAALVIRPATRLVERSAIPVAFASFLAAFLATAIPLALVWAGLAFESAAPIVGGIFPYLPGAALVASMLDGISRSPFSALARGLAAVVTAVALAVGVLAALNLALALEVPPGSPPIDIAVIVGGLTTAVAMASLGVASQLPVRLLPATVLLGVIGWYVGASGSRGPVTEALVFLAAALVGAGGQLAARAQRTVAVAYTGIAILPLVPGRLIYGAMFSFAIGASGVGAEQLLDALFVSVAVAAGVALGLGVMQQVPGPRAVAGWVRRR